MQIIYDHQLDTKTLMPLAVQALEQFFRAADNGNTLSPPRHAVNVDNGGLCFTIGAETEFSQSIGFRVYDTFPSETGTDGDQIIAVYSSQNGKLKGIFIGAKLGAIRTAAINAVAIKHMSNPNCQTATIIGAGYQAAYQTEALLAVRQPKTIYIHNRNTQNAKALINRLTPLHNVNFQLSDNLQTSLSKSDIVICATSSPKPVLQTKWLKANAYVGTIGAKHANKHELPLDIISKCTMLTTDSISQLKQYQPPYNTDNLTSLANIVTHPKSQQDGIKLFLSCGLSGTEVAIGDAVLKHISPT